MADKKISLEEALTQAAGGPAPEPQETPEAPEVEAAETPAEETTEAPVESEGSTEKTVEVKPVEAKPAEEGEKKPNPMKEVREKYTTEKQMREKIEGAITRFTNGDYSFKIKDFNVDGKVDYDALTKAMDEADTKVKAESRGITPEVQAEIDRIEKEKIELNKQRLQVSMDRALTNLQINMNIKNSEINNFFKDAMAQKKNPYQWLAQGGDLQDLYILVYRDRLLKEQINAALEKERAKLQEESSRQAKVPVANPAKPAQPKTTNTTGPSLQDLLAQAAKK